GCDSRSTDRGTLGFRNRDVAARADFRDRRADRSDYFVVAEVECADAAEVHSKLSRVRPFGPGDVIEELVGGALYRLFARALCVDVDRLVENERSRICAGNVDGYIESRNVSRRDLSEGAVVHDVAVAKLIDQILTDGSDRRESQIARLLREIITSFAIDQIRLICSRRRDLGAGGLRLERPVLIDLIIKPEHREVRFEIGRKVRGEPVCVEPVADGEIVWRRHQSQCVKDARIRANVSRIQRLRIDCDYSTRSIAEPQNPLLEGIGGNQSRNLLSAGQPPPFIVEKEEDFLFPYRPAQRSAESIVDQRWPLDPQSIVIPGVRVEHRALIILVGRSVKLIRAALGYESHLRTRRASEGRVRVSDGNAQFVERFRGHRYHRAKGQSDHVIGDVDAVKIESILIGSRTGNLAAGRDPRLQSQQTRRLA